MKLFKKNKDGFRTADILSISIAHHIHDIYTSFLAPLKEIISDTFGLNNYLFGWLAVAQRIPTLLNPFIGIFAEKIRLRYLMIVAPTITAISMSLIGSVSSYVSLLTLVFISGFSSMLFHVPTPVMIKQIAGKRVGKGMSYYMVGGEFARTLGPIIILAAVDLWGFNGIFRLIPAGVLASLILYFRFKDADIRKNFPKNTNEGSYINVLVKYTRVLALIASITLFRGAMKSFFTYYLVGYLNEAGYSNWLSGIALSTIYLSGTAGVFITGRVSDIIGKKNTLLIVGIISPLLMWLFIQSNGFATFPLLIIIGFFLLAPTPVFLSIVNSIESEHVTFLNGVYMTSNFLMSSLATLFAGYALDHIGYQLSFKIAAGIAFLAIPAIILLPKK
jgi:FSR family fosmidomycin resistance protein-like MFS transporter